MANDRQPLVNDAVRFIDQRTSTAALLHKTLRYPFPDHWSFLLGEVALYAFIVLIATGTYLALFFEPSLAKTVYHGSYAPLHGLEMSRAYRSAINISFDYRAGLLIRQTHHWAADVFVAAIVLHVMRNFFTGAFRKPRELTWLLGLTVLTVALLEGYLGYSMVDDLLSGMGLAIGYGVALSIPFFGANLALGLWGGPYPGADAWESRMFIAHVFIFPALIAVLLGAHLALVALKHHTQFRRSSRRASEKRVVGVPLFPAQTPRSLGLLLMTTAVLFLLGGLVQINPIWQWGPYSVPLSTNGAQPDWYLGWLIGALRLVPSFDLVIGGYTLVPNPFWGGVLFPGIVFTLLGAWPWIERRLTGDHAFHNIADRPRDNPLRTAVGASFFTWVFLIFAAGSADRIYVWLNLSYEGQIWAYRVLIWVIPAIVFVVTLRFCRALQVAEALELEQELAEERAEQLVAERARLADEAAGQRSVAAASRASAERP